jgi:hypothetical protein
MAGLEGAIVAPNPSLSNRLSGAAPAVTGFAQTADTAPEG